MKTIVLLVIALTVTGCGFAQIAPYSPPTNKWSATLKVVDEAGGLVDKANVQISYMIPPPPGKGGWGTYGNYGDKIEGMTDKDGMFSASHRDSTHSLGFQIEKAGYYKTFLGYQMGLPERYNYEKWNPSLTLVLKKIRQPIAMYAKSLNVGLPALDQPVGYDLSKGDWVAPHGTGVNTDIIFKGHLERRSEFDSDYTLTVSFPNPGDGLQEFIVPEIEKGSELRSPHETPSTGYQPEWIQTDNRKPKTPIKTNRDPKRNYFFRVRTVLDENGNVKSAHYGKIYGDFMEFKYYLNPTPNDRNVEFDPKRNLIKNAPSFEEVREP